MSDLENIEIDSGKINLMMNLLYEGVDGPDGD